MRSTRQGSIVATGVVPPGGENVTMQQLMETMRGLQKTMAASRVEIAASQADKKSCAKPMRNYAEI